MNEYLIASFFCKRNRAKFFQLGFAVFLFLVSSLPFSLKAQVDVRIFKSLTTKDGLPQNSVVAISQDDDGFMWFGTYEGLSRYDGYDFKNYARIRDDYLGLSDNQVRTICQYHENTLLVGTENGLNIFNTHTEEFARFFHDPLDSNSLSNNIVFDVLKDSDGDIWVATWGGGINKFEDNGFNKDDLSELEPIFKRYDLPADIFSSNSLKTTDIAEGAGGVLWIATLDGLFKFDKTTALFEVYRHDSNNINSISSNNISSVCIDHRGLVWSGTWGGGLNVLDPTTDEVIRFAHHTNNKKSIANDIVMNLYTDRDGTVWVGTWGGGLCKVNFQAFGKEKDDIDFTIYENDRNVSSSISGNSIYCIYEDNNGLMWVGTDWSGVNKFNNEEAIFKHVYAKPGSLNSLSSNIVFSIVKSVRGEVWIGTNKGVQVYDPKTGKFIHYVHDPADETSISHDFVKSIIEDSNGDIWFGGIRGLFKFNREENNFDRVFVDHNELYALCAAKDGSIWAGSYGRGIYRYNPKDRTVSSVLLPDEDGNYLIDNVIWSIAEDLDSTLWIGSREAGLYSYNPRTEDFAVYHHIPGDTASLAHNTVVSLFVDHQGDLWIGTELCLDKLEYTAGGDVYFRHFTKEDGLAANHIKGISEDQFKNLWITTTNGISRFNVERNEFVTFNLDDGIQDIEFHSNALFVDQKEGVIYAGGINGFNYFSPEEVQIDLTPPITRLTELKIFNKSVAVGQEVAGRVVLKSTIGSVNSLELSYRDKAFSLAFAAQYYSAPEGCNYAFILEGFEDNWNYVGKQRLATYTNLKPGKYTFKVKASNADNVWNEEPTSLKIIIKPPWWRTLVFRMLLAAFLIGGGFFLYQMRIDLLKKRQKLLEDNVGERTEDLNKLNVVLKDKQKEISIQNDQLLAHRNNLERLVEERTAELYDAKIRAEESDRLKSAFLSNMSHEVRTPMNAIIGFTNLLEDDDISLEERKRFINMISSNGEALMDLFNNILDISKIESGQLKLYKERFCLEEVLVEACEFFDTINTKQFNIILKLNDSKTYLFNDLVRFKQVVNNLISNAVKFTEYGEVVISYKVVDDRLELSVEDTGIGISYEDQQNIFNNFHKIDDDVTKLYRGIGVGLTICKHVIDLMGGSIYVESKVGEGSKFTILLPQEAIESKNKPLLHSRGEGEVKKVGFDIVIAEDEQTNFDLVKRILRKIKANLHWARNGEEAVALVSRISLKRNCLVLMDVKMPVMGGFDAFDLIKKIDKNIPVIAVTAYAQPLDKARILEHGFDAYLPKPLKFKDLTDIVESYSKKNSLDEAE